MGGKGLKVTGSRGLRVGGVFKGIMVGDLAFGEEGFWGFARVTDFSGYGVYRLYCRVQRFAHLGQIQMIYLFLMI